MLESPLDGAWIDERVATLSRRETQVLEMASRGMTNAQMATDLGITIHAVKFHLASIYRKLGVANRTEAAVVYLQGPGRLAPAAVLPRPPA